MKITFERWVLATALGCAVLWTALVPTTERHDDESRDEMRPTDWHRATWWARYRGRSEHRQRLLSAYHSSMALELATAAFGSKPATAGDPDIWFASDVPAVTRARMLTLLEAERVARGPWRGHGAVGVMVILDTATFDVARKQGYVRRGWLLSTRILMPSPAFGNRCVTVVRLRGPVPTSLDSIAPSGTLLDGCAFFDAFGRPGAEISRWLTATRFGRARSYAFVLPDSLRPVADRYRLSPYGWRTGSYAAGRRCHAGVDAACMALLDSALTVGSDGIARPPVNGSAGVTPQGADARDAMLGSLARDLGAPRFDRVWRSPKPLALAYLDETGEPLANWIRRQDVAQFAEARLGPATSPWSMSLTLLTVLALLGAAVRFAARPRV